jgi:hypothetical protein
MSKASRNENKEYFKLGMKHQKEGTAEDFMKTIKNKEHGQSFINGAIQYMKRLANGWIDDK